MSELFALNYSGPPFQLLGPAHIGALCAILILNLSLLPLRRAAAETRRRARWILAFTIWSAEAGWHAWNLAVGNWSPQVMLPLNLCSALIWISGWMLLRQDHHTYDFVYFLGIGGGLQYLATPDLGRYGFPHFRFVQAYLAHGLLLTAPVYMTLVEQFRPSWASMKRVIIGANLYMLPIFLLNRVLGSNYLMLNAKPSTASLLDLLPPWPYYILYMEIIGLVTCMLLYLPWAIHDIRNRGQ